MELQIILGDGTVKELKLTKLDEDDEAYVMEVDDGDTEYNVFVSKREWRKI